MNRTKIPWCDWTWNPIVGCSPASKGCANCYAKRMSRRMANNQTLPKHVREAHARALSDDRTQWANPAYLTLLPERLDEPLKVRKPGRVFVCSMTDIGHETVRPEWREKMYAAMRVCPQHTFIILTKRPAALMLDRPPVNVWMGVSVCEQEDDGSTWGVLRLRRHVLHEKRVLFASVEPMLGPVTFAHWGQKPDWVIAGPETGPKARPCDDAWIDALAAESPCFFDKRAGGTRREWPKR